jgi:S-DNA-T family DNA segregation ATPase FtsK/SpoIIIE
MAENDGLPPFEANSVGLPPGHPWGREELPTGERDPCLDKALGQYAMLLQGIADTVGNVQVNEPFGDNWRRNPSPSLVPPGVYSVGEAVFPDGTRVRYDVPLLDQGHIEFPANESGLRMVRAVMQRVQGDVDPRDLRLIVCDSWLGKATADFRHRGDELYEQVSAKERAALLANLEREATRINNNVLLDWSSLREQARTDPEVLTAGHRPEPWRVVAILGNGEPLSPEETASLSRLTALGPACGIHFLMWNIPVPEGMENVTRVGEEVHVFNQPPQEEGKPDTQAPGPLAVAAISREIAAIFHKPLASPDYNTFRQLSAERTWSGNATFGLDAVVALDERGRPLSVKLDDGTPHWYTGGMTGSGKSSLIMGVICQLAEKYSPEELKIFLMDFKGEGEQPAILAGNQRDPTYLPHCENLGFGEGLDDEYSLSVLAHLEAEIARRSRLFTKAGTTDYKSYREETGEKLPRILCVFDEVQRLMQGPLVAEVVARLNNLARTARSYGIHLLLGTQKMPAEHTLPGVPAINEMLTQFPGRFALPRSEVLDFDNNSNAATLPQYHVIVNTSGGASNANTIGRFADTSRKIIVEAKQRLMTHMEEQGQEYPRPQVYNGARKPPLAEDPSYQALRPSEMRAPKALIGKSTGLEDAAVSVEFPEDRGRNLTIYGRRPESVCDVLDATVLSLSRQHKPGTGTEATFHVVCTSNNPEMQDRAEAVARQLGAEGQKVSAYGRRRAADAVSAVATAVATGRQTKEYLIIYGAEGAAGVVDGGELQEVMTNGPQLGVHTLLTSSSPEGLGKAAKGPQDYGPTGADVRQLSDVWVATESTPGDLQSLVDVGEQPPQWRGQARRLIYYDKAHADRLGSDPVKLRTFHTYEEE